MWASQCECLTHSKAQWQDRTRAQLTKKTRKGGDHCCMPRFVKSILSFGTFWMNIVPSLLLLLLLLLSSSSPLSFASNSCLMQPDTHSGTPRKREKSEKSKQLSWTQRSVGWSAGFVRSCQEWNLSIMRGSSQRKYVCAPKHSETMPALFIYFPQLKKRKKMLCLYWAFFQLFASPPGGALSPYSPTVEILSKPAWGDRRRRPTSLLPPHITCKRCALLWLDSEWLWVISVRNICCILCCCVWLRGSRGGTPSTVVLVLLLLVVLHHLWQPETVAKEVDQRLAEVLLRPVAVQEVSLIRVDLHTHTQACMNTQQQQFTIFMCDRFFFFFLRIMANKSVSWNIKILKHERAHLQPKMISILISLKQFVF